MEAGSAVKYRRLKEIGKGAYGVIYLAEMVNFEPTDEESEDEKYVALKRLMTDVGYALKQEKYGLDFSSIREIKILKETNHPNIIRLRDVYIENKSIFLAMDYMVCDLARLLSDKKHVMTEGDIVHIFRQIVSAVDHLHKRWIMHRVVPVSP